MEDPIDNSGTLPKQTGLNETIPIAAESPLTEGSAPTKCRLGFLEGQYTVPDDIKTMFAEEIEEMFYGLEALGKFDRVAKAADEQIRRELEAKS